MFALVGVQLSVEPVGRPVEPPDHVPSTLGAVLVASVHLVAVVEGLLELCHKCSDHLSKFYLSRIKSDYCLKGALSFSIENR